MKSNPQARSGRVDNDDFYVEPANWRIDRDDIEPIRLQVFVDEQQVPEDEEFDDDDPTSQHFLARATAGEVIGTGRLTTDGRIGRMAVLREWRGRGVGRALLRAAVEAARLRKMSEVRLSAQVQAEGFYRGEGFVAEGEIFDDVGIPHRWMRLRLEGDFVEPVARKERQAEPIDRLTAGPFQLSSEYAEQLVQLIRCTRRRLDIFTRDLEPAIFDRSESLEALKALLAFGADPNVRILALDTGRAVQQGHRWIELSQQRSSAMTIRNPPKQFQDYASAFVIADARHVLFRDLGSRPEGHLHVNNPQYARQLQDFFDEAWEHGTVDPDTRRLEI